MNHDSDFSNLQNSNNKTQVSKNYFFQISNFDLVFLSISKTKKVDNKSKKFIVGIKVHNINFQR